MSKSRAEILNRAFAHACLRIVVVATLVFVATAKPQQAQAQDKCDTLVVCPAKFQDALQPWVDYRSKQGHVVRVVAPRVSTDQIKKEIRKEAASGQLKFVFLIGDPGEKLPVKPLLVPMDYVDSKVTVLFGSEPEIATDSTFADIDEDGVPDLAIGRLPVDSAQELRDFTDRVIEYEESGRSQAFAANSNQQWRRNINIVAGVGGFGSTVDSVIENTTKQIITDLVPERYRTSMTFGSWRSPYCPDPRRFSETAIGKFNEGCMFWVYIGHGSPQQLDRVVLPDQSHPILDKQTAEQLHCENGSPIALFLSCYTGAVDHETDCLAEAMLKQPRGPIATICGTRVTMPYAMSLLSLEMVNEFFDGDCGTLGELTMIAKQRMVAEQTSNASQYRQMIDVMGKMFSPRPKLLKEECLEHVQLIHLLGDPLLRLSRPQKIKVKAEQIVEAGRPMNVTGVAPESGEMTVELVYRRDRFKTRPPHRRRYESSDQAFRDYQEIYEQSQQLTCSTKKIFVAQGPFEIQLDVPRDVGGRCAVRCMLDSEATYGLGSSLVEVKKAPSKREASVEDKRGK